MSMLSSAPTAGFNPYAQVPQSSNPYAQAPQSLNPYAQAPQSSKTPSPSGVKMDSTTLALFILIGIMSLLGVILGAVSLLTMPSSSTSSSEFKLPLDVDDTNILNVATPTENSHAANKSYVDSAATGLTFPIDFELSRLLRVADPVIGTDGANLDTVVETVSSTAVLKTGLTANLSAGSFKITDLATPTLDGDAVRKDFVEDNFLPVSGGALTSNLPCANNRITTLGTPTSSQDAATKGYVDTEISGLSANIGVGTETALDILSVQRVITHRWFRGSSGGSRDSDDPDDTIKKTEYDIHSILWLVQNTLMRCIEIDMIASSDGVLYVSHGDADFSNVGIPSIAAATSTEIDAISHVYSRGHYGRNIQKIYRVSYVLGLLKPYECAIFAEIKAPTTYLAFENAMKKVNYSKRLVVLTSFDEPQLVAAKAAGYYTMYNNSADPTDTFDCRVLSESKDFDTDFTISFDYNGLFDGSAVTANALVPYQRYNVGSQVYKLFQAEKRFIYSNWPLLWANEMGWLSTYSPFPNTPWIRFTSGDAINGAARGDQIGMRTYTEDRRAFIKFDADPDLSDAGYRKMAYLLHLRQEYTYYLTVNIDGGSTGSYVGLHVADRMPIAGTTLDKSYGYLLKITDNGTNYVLSVTLYNNGTRTAGTLSVSDTGITTGSRMYVIFRTSPTDVFGPFDIATIHYGTDLESLSVSTITNASTINIFEETDLYGANSWVAGVVSGANSNMKGYMDISTIPFATNSYIS